MNSNINVYDTWYKIEDLTAFNSEFIELLNSIHGIKCDTGINNGIMHYYIKNSEPYNYAIHDTKSSIKCDYIEENFMTTEQVNDIREVQNSVDFTVDWSWCSNRNTILNLTESQVSKDIELLIKKHGVKL